MYGISIQVTLLLHLTKIDYLNLQSSILPIFLNTIFGCSMINLKIIIRMLAQMPISLTLKGLPILLKKWLSLRSMLLSTKFSCSLN